MPISGQQHCDPAIVRGSDDIGVLLASTRLHDGGDAGIRQYFETVGEGEKGIGGSHAAHRLELGLLDRDPAGVDAAHLARPDTDRLALVAQDDCVASV